MKCSNCGCGKNRHIFVAWMPGACMACNCDDYEAAKE